MLCPVKEKGDIIPTEFVLQPIGIAETVKPDVVSFEVIKIIG